PSVLTRPTIGGRVRIVMAAEGLMSYLVRKFKYVLSKLWHFILEAKDLKPTPLINHQVQKVKQVFRVRIRSSKEEPLWMPEVATILDQAKSAPDGRTAEHLYLDAIKNDPNNKEAYEGLGRLYLQEKNYKEAAETFRFLTRLDPKRDTYWSNLGMSLYSIQQYKEASVCYEKAVQINGKVPARWVNLSLCYEAIHDLPRMVRALNQAVTLDRRNINYLMLLAEAYMKVQNKIRAEDVLESILTIDPTHKVARERLMKIRI
ncbi:MAG TPA: tetratricopeptide repeat protein, partial [Candidatus Binatia bacterium]|nr:tetratricopeptide repeat protein [Candidatus Binatia bacterium]